VRVFITATAGLNGFYVAGRLLTQGYTADGLSLISIPGLNEARREVLLQHENYHDNVSMLETMAAMKDAAEQSAPDVVIYLAAHVGVRYSLENPHAYLESNFIGRDFTYFDDLIEGNHPARPAG
jgi:UDP-glucuronate 4-epimerase